MVKRLQAGVDVRLQSSSLYPDLFSNKEEEPTLVPAPRRIHQCAYF